MQWLSKVKIGEVAEWLKAHAWKVCIRVSSCIEGSNPSLSATNNVKINCNTKY